MKIKHTFPDIAEGTRTQFLPVALNVLYRVPSTSAAIILSGKVI